MKNVRKPKSNEFIFYFDFALEDEETGADKDTTLGFLVKSDLINEYDSFDEFIEVVTETHTDEIESDYGVHDWASHPVKGYNAFGYNSYEVEESKVYEVLERWRQVFIQNFDATVSDIVEIGTVETDKTAFEEILSKV